ncbi:acyl-CoA thioesterase [Nocardia otitidiscaviarum]|uniref:Acyl-CoA thioesterase n=1 Tax=Nocardia otitidiscaviarum TaxID=1823 RepID=A0A516NQ94_9NOCA|nr:acyl-CoA thioesterase [Nocardia otitidiscaviarum]MCP9620188.1 acyl-CoA thioesterase [Nocardia otitidiscaviarum]QDP81075.1 acyl-CoA thioesterase [Nocardia otitidiscaviarum]
MTTLSDEFRIRIDVRISDIDPQLHVTSAAYQQYADHSRFECVQAAGVSVSELLRDGLGPVNLEAVIKFHRELRVGDCVDVTCAWVWGGGKTYRVENTLRRPDGELVATLSYVCGLLDLERRTLVADPAAVWAARAKDPTILGL